MYREVISQEKNGPSQDGLSLMLVASAYYALGKFEPALSVYQRAGIKLKEQMNNSTEYTICCAKLFNNIGCVYFEIGKYEKAMQTFQRALQLFHNSRLNYAAWNAAISDQSSIMNNMAYILTKFKQYDDASDLVDASFELQQIIPGTTNTLTISTLGTMAFIYYRTKKYKLSLDTYSGMFRFCWRYSINQSIFLT
jgi:tetratricopeptide (TPR) repeat protein